MQNSILCFYGVLSWFVARFHFWRGIGNCVFFVAANVMYYFAITCSIFVCSRVYTVCNGYWVELIVSGFLFRGFAMMASGCYSINVKLCGRVKCKYGCCTCITDGRRLGTFVRSNTRN